jgi:hypothetical protein
MSLMDEVGGGLDGLSQLRMLMASGRKPGILVALDFEFVEVESGKAVFAGTPGEHAYNPIGTVHGGYAATLLDSACGCAVHSQLTATHQQCLDAAPPNHAGDAPDVSRADFTFALIASDWGHPAEQVAARLMEYSTKARENGQRYADLTARKAAAIVAVRTPRPKGPAP